MRATAGDLSAELAALVDKWRETGHAMTAFERVQMAKQRAFTGALEERLNAWMRPRIQARKLGRKLYSPESLSPTETPSGGKKHKRSAEDKKRSRKRGDQEEQEQPLGKKKKRSQQDLSLPPSSISGCELSDLPIELDEDAARRALWKQIARKIIPKVSKAAHQGQSIRSGNCRKIAATAAQIARRSAVAFGSRQSRPLTVAKRVLKEMLMYWKKNEREERELRKKAEKEAAEKRRQEEEAREARRQAKKLNFLITQTELYSHFVGRKRQKSTSDKLSLSSISKDTDFADVDDSVIAQEAERLAMKAAEAHQARLEQFATTSATSSTLNFMNPSTLQDAVLLEQPSLLQVNLKSYQLKGLTWLASLYEQGINGILADEMGLGKTIQSISLLAHLAERHNIWGPFIIVTPASTLHNWQQEFARFVPALKILPYWGSVQDRKVLRSSCFPMWSASKRQVTRDTPFHVMVTSYQLVVSDEQYLNKIKWQYMILDEAQAIKSSSSIRWKTLLSFNCRNRLLITGTPIQNSMQELWALLHFIMPTLFDSHDEFSEWFSKDIEQHAEKTGGSTATNTSALNAHQVARLHMILKPFMLRRVKADVENEMAEKTEKEIICELSPRQKRLYRGIKDKLPVLQLLNTASLASESALMNLVMQFRKVCNHPELLEPTTASSPLVFAPVNYCRGALVRLAPGPIEYRAPRLVVEESMSAGSGRFLELGDSSVALDVMKLPAMDAKALPVHVSIPSESLVNILNQGAVEKVLTSPIEMTVSSASLGRIFDVRNQELSALVSSQVPRLDSHIQIPQMEKFIRDSGKMSRMDQLLVELKAGGHRVLIYNQMTRMIDMMEEYLQFRGYSYVRLDGSTNIGVRRDLVHAWQTDPSIFVFLLSTRAGGLGINLTAADTVIFYDSDWNPTVDQQAMDRAHRLGQLKPVTVYRLITRNSVEERIMQRARQKDEIHRVVIAGGAFKNEDNAALPSSSATGSSREELMKMLLVDEE